MGGHGGGGFSSHRREAVEPRRHRLPHGLRSAALVMHGYQQRHYRTGIDVDAYDLSRVPVLPTYLRTYLMYIYI